VLDTSVSGKVGIFWGSRVSERHWPCVLRLSVFPIVALSLECEVDAAVFLAVAFGVARYLAYRGHGQACGNACDNEPPFS
jgi:hypothetical protein